MRITIYWGRNIVLTLSYFSLSIEIRNVSSVDFNLGSKSALSVSTKQVAAIDPSLLRPDFLAAVPPALIHWIHMLYKVSRQDLPSLLKRVSIAAQVERLLLPVDLVSREANGMKKKPECSSTRSWGSRCRCKVYGFLANDEG